MTTVYTFSLIAILFCVAIWDYLDDEKNDLSPLKVILWILVPIYLATVLFGEGSLGYKLKVVLLRDLGLFVGLIFIGFMLTRLQKLHLLFLICLLPCLIYFRAGLPRSPASSRVPLAAGAELLFDIGNGVRLNQIQSALADFDVTIKRAFPDLNHPEYSELDDFYTLDLADAQLSKLSRVIKALYDTGAVDWVERNEVVTLSPMEGTVTQLKSRNAHGPFPNDPEIGRQWAFEALGLADFHNAMGEVSGARPALIAVLDTGVDAGHPDLLANYDSTDPSFDKDEVGHGTHCAGTAGAVSNNGIGIASLVPGGSPVRITSIKVLGPNGGTQRSVIAGMIRAADMGADVLSMSLGGFSDDDGQRAYEEAVKYVNKSGAIVVAAAGNDNGNAADYVPAGVAGVIVVSAVDRDLKKAAFSNSVADVEMGIAAPGVEIYASLPGGNYGALSGTSMAAPHVSGLLGLLKALRPDLTTSEAFELLHNSGRAIADEAQTGRLIQPLEVLSELIHR